MSEMWAFTVYKLAFISIVVVLVSIELRVYFSTLEKTGIVNTESGKLQGLLQLSRDGKQFASFYGIPYAEPPIRQLRFAPPRPGRKWEGVRLANERGIECIHYDYILDRGIRGQEDCLILNVFTPAIKHEDDKVDVDASKSHPVIVFIPGGGFMSGSSAMYEGHYFMDEDVVLVTLNYRVGALGFLNSGDSIITGNMGLKDQLLALKWVQSNIRNFGGDPEQVTLMGESAGAISAHLHMLSQRSAGLFKRVILMSGHVLTPWAIKKNPEMQTQRFAEKMGCSAIVPSELLHCLWSLEARDIVQSHAVHRNIIVEPYESYGPTLESVRDSDAFMTVHPKETLFSSTYQTKPVVLGLNEAEGLIWVARALADNGLKRKLTSFSEWLTILPHLLGIESQNPQDARKITKFYFDVDGKDFNPLSHIENFTNLYSDRVFNMHMQKIVNEHLSNGISPMHLYYYTYRGDFSLFELATSVPKDGIFPSEVYLGYGMVRKSILNMLGQHEKLPAGHADELPLLFNVRMFPVKPGSRDYAISKEIIRTFVQFASARETLTFRNADWVQVSKASRKYMNIDVSEETSMVTPPFEARVGFWDNMKFSRPN